MFEKILEIFFSKIQVFSRYEVHLWTPRSCRRTPRHTFISPCFLCLPQYENNHKITQNQHDKDQTGLVVYIQFPINSDYESKDFLASR